MIVIRHFFGALFLIYLSFFSCFGQNKITFRPSVSGINLELGKEYSLQDNANQFQISTLKFFISDISFWNKDNIVSKISNKYFLLDLEDPNSLNIPFELAENQSFSSIKFKLGIDSLTNVSGAMEGDLDPTNGMYWAWQSGYINFKLEGTSTNCPARKNKFQFHLGGYLSPFYGMREIEIPVSENNEINIQLELGTFLNLIDLSETYQIMSPNTDAMKLADEISKLFRLQK